MQPDALFLPRERKQKPVQNGNNKSEKFWLLLDAYKNVWHVAKKRWFKIYKLKQQEEKTNKRRTNGKAKSKWTQKQNRTKQTGLS